MSQKTVCFQYANILTYNTFTQLQFTKCKFLSSRTQKVILRCEIIGKDKF